MHGELYIPKYYKRESLKYSSGKARVHSVHNLNI